MPVLVDKLPFAETRRAARADDGPGGAVGHSEERDEVITIGLINNMPDAALEGTARQFFTLLHDAAADRVVRLKLFALPGVPRGSFGREHVRSFYADLHALWGSGLDGVIVTGTEPRAGNLADEPYWRELTEVMDWAEDTTVASLWSCLAAHAAVFHLDGIPRQPRADKCFGVFEHRRVGEHRLLQGLPARLLSPHSRWNEVSGEALTAAGYAVLTRSAEAGVDLFVKQRNSLFMLFQGHPEYEVDTLLREYRRDVGRFLRGERDSYPLPPAGYFDRDQLELIEAFRVRALTRRSEDLLAAFPSDRLMLGLAHSWRAEAVRIYRNFLGHIAARKAQRGRRPMTARRAIGRTADAATATGFDLNRQDLHEQAR